MEGLPRGSQLQPATMSMRSIAFGAIVVLSGFRVGAQAPVPVHAEPRHRMVWEAGSIRVLDVQVPPGDTSLYHVHDAPILYIPVAISSMDAQPLGGKWIGLGPTSPSRFSLTSTDSDTLYAVRPVTHRVANVGTLPFRLIAVINGRSRAEIDSGPDGEPPPGMLQHHSSWFHQTRVSLPTGGTTPLYTSASAVVVVQPGAGEVFVDEPSASRSQALDRPGSFRFVPAGTGFTVRNASADPASVVIVRVR